ncbi:nuclear transport factor 2 family protein [bacterium]|nr:nuclear transport factor 2 family protein [bacterium]
MKSLLLVVIVTISSISWSQTDSTRQTEVRAVIDQLFGGMFTGDSSLVRSVFHTDARVHTSYKTEGAYQLHEGSISAFINAVGTPHDKIWDERISNVVIQIDDGLAQVWMDYSFYIGGEFSHKGVNAIQLAYMDGRWQILNLTDTRRKA